MSDIVVNSVMAHEASTNFTNEANLAHEVCSLLFINMHLLDIRDRLTSSEYVHRQKWKWLRIQLVLLFAHLTENTYGCASTIRTLMYKNRFMFDFNDPQIQTLLSNSGLKIANRLQCIETAINSLLQKYNISTNNSSTEDLSGSINE